MDQAYRRSVGMAYLPYAFPPQQPTAMNLMPPGFPGTELPGLGGMWTPADHAALEENKLNEQRQRLQRPMVQGGLPGVWNVSQASPETPESAQEEGQQAEPPPDTIEGLDEILTKSNS